MCVCVCNVCEAAVGGDVLTSVTWVPHSSCASLSEPVMAAGGPMGYSSVVTCKQALDMT